MKKLKSIINVISLVLLIALALCGIGLIGADPFLFKKREQDKDNETKTELVEGELRE